MDETDDRRRGDHEEREARRARRRRARKERVLHTRISEELSEDIRRMADELRVPVSNIVRNVLEEAFSVVETVTDNVGDLIEDVMDEAEAASERIRRQRRRRHRASARAPGAASESASARAPGAASESASASVGAASRERDGDRDVLGWQPMVLARSQRCGDCGQALAPGDQAFAAVTERGIGSAYVCPDCLDARS